MTLKNQNTHTPVVSPVAFVITPEPCAEAIDAESSAEVIAELTKGNIWAWCNVRVTAVVTVVFTKPRIDASGFGLDTDPERPSFMRFEGSDVCVGYRGFNEEHFKHDSQSLFEHMKHLAMLRLNARLREIITQGMHAGYALQQLPEGPRYLATQPVATSISNIDEVLELVTELSTRLELAHEALHNIAEACSPRIRKALDLSELADDVLTACVDVLHDEALARNAQYDRVKKHLPLNAYPSIAFLN